MILKTQYYQLYFNCKKPTSTYTSFNELYYYLDRTTIDSNPHDRYEGFDILAW